MRNTTILDVTDIRTRDLLRGLFSQKEETQLRPTFSRLMQTVNFSDLPVVDSLLRSSSLYRHLDFRDEFPLGESPFTETICFDILPRPSARIEYVKYRSNLSASRLAQALRDIHTINEAIFEGDDLGLLENIAQFLDNHGHSLTLARKFAFILAHFGRETESWKTASGAFSSYGLESRNYGMMAVADTIGTDFPYLGIKSSFAKFSSLGARATASRRIAYLSFNPILFDEAHAIDGLAASYFFSLLDAVIFFLSHRSLGVFSSEHRLDPQIESAWMDIQDQTWSNPKYIDGNDQFVDATAFRTAPAFLELKPFREYRAALQRLYNVPEIRETEKVFPNKYEIGFFEGVNSIEDLLPSNEQVYDALPTRFDRKVAGNLTRTCGLVRVTLDNPDFSLVNAAEVGRLMGHTSDVDRLLSPSTLRSASVSARDPFVILILLILLRAHSPLTLDLFNFKRNFQRYVNENCGGNIISFIESVHDIDRGIVEYLVPLLDETTLSQVPFLVNTAEGVYETRALILEWFSRRFDEPSYSDKAKQLRIDRKIASVRGQINETRINIDGLRFRQWVETSKQSEFSALIRQEAAAAPYIEDARSKRSFAEIRLSAHRDPNARAAVAIMDSYREFCTNADFGIASYLGRRIRHGTLKGTLLDNLPTPEEYKVSSSVKAQFDRWLEGFKQLINQITEMLHFQGKGTSSNAVISADVDSKEKWDIAMACLQAIYDTGKMDHGATVIPSVIEQYCWYIFEVELRHIQSVVLAARSDSTLFKDKTPTIDISAANFEKAINLVITNHFNTVSSWFKKPPNISPVAEVGNILEVVKREAQAEYTTFDPEVAVQGEDIKLSGGIYYHVYDALSVIVRNAAKHGAHPGTLSVNARRKTTGDAESMTINVLSAVRGGDTATAGVDRIYEAAGGGAENADVVEGLSGIRKLEKMKVDGALVDFCIVPHDCDQIIEIEIAFVLKRAA